MKKQLGELKKIYLYTNAVCRDQAFDGVLTDLDIENLGAKALKVIDEQIGDELANTVKKRLEISQKVLVELSKHNEKVLQTDYDYALNQNKDFLTVLERENELLNKEAEFEFEPIEIALEKGQKLDFPELTELAFKGERLNLVPYPCFRELLKLGVLTVKK